MPLSEKVIHDLNAEYPWPRVRPDFKPAEWVLDGGGKGLVFQHIAKSEPFLIVEIGAFLGSSVKQWLAVSPDVYVIAIDPWDGAWWADYARTHGRDALAEQFSMEDGPYKTFLSSLWESRRRIIPVRGTSPEKLYELVSLGIKPDLFYFDSNKTGEDIEIAHQLFPEAILTGDDWTWGMEQGYPIRTAVRAFADRHDYHVVSDRATWVLKRGTPGFSDRICNLLNSARDMARVFRRFVT